jgi:hypothetical protein
MCSCGYVVCVHVIMLYVFVWLCCMCSCGYVVCVRVVMLYVFVWLFQLLNTKRMDADPGKGERKLTVMNVSNVFLLALEFTCRESKVTVFAMVFLTTTKSLIFHRVV